MDGAVAADLLLGLSFFFFLLLPLSELYGRAYIAVMESLERIVIKNAILILNHYFSKSYLDFFDVGAGGSSAVPPRLRFDWRDLGGILLTGVDICR